MNVYHVHVEVVRTIIADDREQAARKVESEIDATPNLVRVGNTTLVLPANPGTL